MGKKRKHEEGEEVEEEGEESSQRQQTPAHVRNQDKRLIVILERANLESVKNGKGYELLNCDDHMGLMKKYNKNPANYRPDILHQCLLMLQDSPLNQSGKLQVYIHTEKNVLIEVNPQCRIPRTFKRFAGLMVQLLHKLSVRASDGNMKLLKVIRNPVTDHLPPGCHKIGTSFTANKFVNPRELVPAKEPIVVVIGAMAHGKVEADYVEEEVSFSRYHLSAALACAKLCSGFEEVWDIK
ncbi:ribosomal RNA small subunit methyltransferase NEP1 isoform X2 [Procambarus clarkii]|uniref:ribosomal RNA small subunit methyltransferase NEP1 isoform X2 n=1 Tax=Procambarus clarkii TaxID=6728 RepID=UPI001E67468D|nr:ribosomal RNA small subunit methyltransferase NEP1-like [Procambarus clarkii]XP_045593267.1 ribosomal RNA small subunit methyltransferase NEP1-like [Procambarus clarkii]